MSHRLFDYTEHLAQLLPLLRALDAVEPLSSGALRSVTRAFPRQDGAIFSKSELRAAYTALAGSRGLKPSRPEILQLLQMKPTRTISGVTPVTVLTKPFPCPGKCIFCPNDIRMPKSYLADEPGAQRAERNGFDPYLQTYSRLQALKEIGHTVEKVEIIVLGGTWSYYPEGYQIWFIHECFRALNDFSAGRDDRQRIAQKYARARERLAAAQRQLGRVDQYVPGSNPQENKAQLSQLQPNGSQLQETYNQVVSEVYTAPEKVSGIDQEQVVTWQELEYQHAQNESALCRCVGLVIETRPDNISQREVERVRRLGCTKTQIGIQSLSDDVLEKNHRGHSVAATRKAFSLLRQAGFKIHAHWMPNLYGSTPEQDKAEYLQLFSDPDFCPDELKIYPCSLIESAELMQYYEDGRWRPYTDEELLDVLIFCMKNTPRYCRLTRVIRDIPSTDIVVGNKKTNFREIAERELDRVGERSQDIRSREIRGDSLQGVEISLRTTIYPTAVGEEQFLEYVATINGRERIAGFLRLLLPSANPFLPELHGCAIIREVHVYGQAVGLGDRQDDRAQHLGLGTRLIDHAKSIAAAAGYTKLAVISAVGTRHYYRQRGFVSGQLYQVCRLEQVAPLPSVVS